MKLLTKKIRAKLPQLYAQDKDPDPVVWVKFFCPWNQWVWLATEFDGEDRFFGYVHGHFDELGYFSLAEMKSAHGPGIWRVLGIERDMHFTPKPLSQVLANHAKTHGWTPTWTPRKEEPDEQVAISQDRPADQ